MSLFRRRQREAADTSIDAPTAPFSELIASDSGGIVSFSLLDRATGQMAPLPPIEMLLRRDEDLKAIVDALRAAGASEADLPVIERVAPGIVTTLGLDEGDRFTTLSENALSQLRLTPALARSGALARLRQACADLTVEGVDGRYRVSYPANPDMAASFMLVTETWLNTDVMRGAPVFGVGSRTFLHICGSNDTEALAGMRQIAATSYEESARDPASHGRPLTPRLLTLNGEHLAEFGTD